MTLSSTTIKDTFAGDGSTKSFDTTWVFWNSSEVQVILVSSQGTETTWTEGTEYTVTGGGGGTGTIAVSTGPTDYTPISGNNLLIKSNVLDVQETSLPAGGTFPSTSVEQEFDRTVRRIQQLAEESNRQVQLAAASTYSNITIPDPSAGQILRWNSTGGATFENVSITGSSAITVPVTVAQGGTAATTAAGARTNLGAQAQDADLDGIAGITYSAQDMLYYGSSGGFVALASNSSQSGFSLVSGGSSAAPSWSSINTFSKNHIAGLECSKTAADQLTVAAGECRDADDAEDIVLSASLAKDVSSSWAVGASNGSLDTGSYTASTLYYVWLIKRTDTDVVDVLTSTSGTEAGLTKPTNYDEFRLIGAFITDSSPDILNFTQVGDYFRLIGDIFTDVSDATISNGVWETATTRIPRHCLGHFYVGASNNVAASHTVQRVQIKTKGAADIYGNEATISTGVTSGNISEQTVSALCLVDGNSQIEYVATESVSTVTTVTILVSGFHMLTRSNPK